MKNAIISFCLVFFINQGCKKESVPKNQIILDTFVNIAYSDSADGDLLDPSHANAIKPGDIEIYYLEDGNKRHVFNPDLDLPKNFKIEKLSDGRYYFMLAVSEAANENRLSTTYIEIKNRSIDTLTAQLLKSGDNIRITKVWYNDTLKWDGNGAASFDIIK